MTKGCCRASTTARLDLAISVEKVAKLLGDRSTDSLLGDASVPRLQRAYKDLLKQTDRLHLLFDM